MSVLKRAGDVRTHPFSQNFQRKHLSEFIPMIDYINGSIRLHALPVYYRLQTNCYSLYYYITRSDSMSYDRWEQHLAVGCYSGIAIMRSNTSQQDQLYQLGVRTCVRFCKQILPHTSLYSFQLINIHFTIQHSCYQSK